MSENLYAWWVTSNPDHPFNAAQPEPEAPKMSERTPKPKVEPGPDPQQVAAEGLARAQAAAAEGLAKAQATAPVSDARPSTIPDDLIPPNGPQGATK